MPDNQIGLEAIFENEQFQQGIAEYNRSVSNADADTASAGSSMSDVWAGLSAVGQAAFTAIGAGIAAMAAELYLAVDAAIDAEEAMARVNFVVAGTAERTGVTTDEVDELASSLSKVLPIDDEVIAQALAMGLTFDGVNQDNIQPLIAAAADLAAWTGSDLPSAMKNLSLSITDPDRAMRLFKEANITLTDEQKKTLKSMGDMGDTAGATAFIMEQLAQKGILGLGEVMADTAKGKFTIMQTALGNLQESLGEGLLDALKDVISRVTEFANDPRTVQFFTDLGQRVGDFAGTVLDKVPAIITVIENLAQWFKDNQPIIIGVLAAIGVAMAAFAITSAAAAIATAASFAPIIAAVVGIAAIVAIFVKAWQEDWGGIQGKVADAWAQVKPVFQQLQQWMKTNLPKAIKLLSDYWNKILLPGMKVVIGWIVDNVLPVLVKLVLWLGDNVPKAIKATSDFFKNTLLPAMKEAGDWIKGTLIPVLTNLRDWFQTHIVNGIKNLVATITGVLTPALNALVNIWRNVLLPALQAVYNFIQANIIPIFNALSNLINAVLGLALRVLAGIWQNVLLPAIQAVYSFIGNIITAFNNVVTVVSGPLRSALLILSGLWDTVKEGIQRLWDKLEPFRSFLAGALFNAFNRIKEIIGDVVTWIQNLADGISNLELPDWLTPGSPTPFEIGLVGINEQLKKLASASLPAIRHQMDVMATVRDVPGIASNAAGSSISNSSQSQRTYVYGANFNIPGPSGFIESLQGL